MAPDRGAAASCSPPSDRGGRRVLSALRSPPACGRLREIAPTHAAPGCDVRGPWIALLSQRGGNYGWQSSSAPGHRVHVAEPSSDAGPEPSAPVPLAVTVSVNDALPGSPVPASSG